MLADIAEEEEDEDDIKVTGLEYGGVTLVMLEGKVAEGGEKVFGDEEGLVGKGEEAEALEGEGEEMWGGENGGEAVAVEVDVGGDGGGEI